MSLTKISQVQELQLEIDALKAALDKAARKPILCIYCGQTFLGDEVGKLQIRRHLAVCEGHPLGRVIAAAEALLVSCPDGLLPPDLVDALRGEIAAARNPDRPIEAKHPKKRTKSP